MLNIIGRAAFGYSLFVEQVSTIQTFAYSYR